MKPAIWWTFFVAREIRFALTLRDGHFQREMPNRAHAKRILSQSTRLILAIMSVVSYTVLLFANF